MYSTKWSEPLTSLLLGKVYIELDCVFCLRYNQISIMALFQVYRSHADGTPQHVRHCSLQIRKLESSRTRAEGATYLPCPILLSQQISSTLSLSLCCLDIEFSTEHGIYLYI